MKVLLDTHIWFWTQDQPNRLGSKARSMLLSDRTEVFVSAVSTLELARLIASGRIQLSKDLLRWTEDGLSALNALSLPVDDEVAVEAYRLPGNLHKDPADRLLIATARIRGLALLTMDDLILSYAHVRSIDARV